MMTAQETHEDGSPHLHCICKVVDPVPRKKVLEFLQTTFPDASQRIDVKGCKSWKQSVTYLSKEDTAPFLLGFTPGDKPKMSQDEFNSRLAEAMYFALQACRDAEEVRSNRQSILLSRPRYVDNGNGTIVPFTI